MRHRLVSLSKLTLTLLPLAPLAACSVTADAPPIGSGGAPTAAASTESPAPSSGLHADIETPTGPRHVRYVVQGTKLVTEGDIEIGTVNMDGSGVTPATGLWPNAKIPYVIPTQAPAGAKAGYFPTWVSAIKKAVSQWNAGGAVQWVPRTNEADYALFDYTLNNNAGSSTTGRGGGMQTISLGENCVGTACEVSLPLHEMGHTLGLWHEQSRHDRDWFVSIVYANIIPGYEGNFDKALPSLDLGVYDLKSIMHYYDASFSIGPATITLADGSPLPIAWPGNTSLSAGDLYAAWQLYHPDAYPADDVVAALTTTATPIPSSPAHKAHDIFCLAGETCFVTDVDGDGQDDLLSFQNAGAGSVLVSLAEAGSFWAKAQWASGFCGAGHHCMAADVDGDGKTDIIDVNQTFWSPNSIRVALSQGKNGQPWSGGSFGTSQLATTAKCPALSLCSFVDVTGDKKADLVTVDLGGAITVFPSTTAVGGAPTFGAAQSWGALSLTPSPLIRYGDVDGDGKSDMIYFERGGSGRVWYLLSTGSYFGSSVQVLTGFCPASHTCAVADMNGDKLVDLVDFGGGPAGTVNVAYGATTKKYVAVPRPHWVVTHSFAAPALFANGFCTGSQTCATGDINGDKRVDLVSFAR